MKYSRLFAALVVLSQLQGCAAAVVAAGAGAVSAANDRRTVGSQIDDNTIEITAELRISQSESINKNSHINIISVNGQVLMVGQTPNDYLREQAQKLISDIDGIVAVHNQIKIGTPTSVGTQTNDVWLTTKVKTQLLTDENLPGNSIKVVTENSEVFLMGLVTKAEADQATEIARNISGVTKVVKIFEFKD